MLIIVITNYMLTVAVFKLANRKNEQNHKTVALILKKKKKKEILETGTCADTRIG